MFTPEALKANMPFVHLVAKWAKQSGCTPAEFVLGWVLSRGKHIAPIPGTTNPKHLDDDQRAASLSLSADEWKKFDEEFGQIKLVGHRADPFTESQIDK